MRQYLRYIYFVLFSHNLVFMVNRDNIDLIVEYLNMFASDNHIDSSRTQLSKFFNEIVINQLVNTKNFCTVSDWSNQPSICVLYKHIEYLTTIPIKSVIVVTNSEIIVYIGNHKKITYFNYYATK